jgi:hypothetical protein
VAGRERDDQFVVICVPALARDNGQYNNVSPEIRQWFRYQKSPKTGETGFVGGSGSHAFYFRDPDWNRIEVYCWRMTATGPSMAAPHPDL